MKATTIDKSFLLLGEKKKNFNRELIILLFSTKRD